MRYREFILGATLVGTILLAGCVETEPKAPTPVIISYDFAGIPFSSPQLDSDKRTIEIKVLYGTDVTNLVAIFTVTESAIVTVEGILQVPNETTNNFSNTVIYNVSSEDRSSSSEWMVNVMVLEEQPIVNKFATVPSNGGIVVKSDGTVFSTSESDKIYKIGSRGTVETFVSNDPNLTRATMIIFDENEEYLYVSNSSLSQLGWITRIGEDGTSQIFSNGFNIPSGIVFDDVGNLYVADQTNTIWIVDNFGQKSIYSQNPSFNRPHGLAWGDNKLYAASAHDGNIFQVSSTTSTLFAHINGLVQPWASGYMTFLNGHLFITNGDNKIHRVSMTGDVSVYAGSGALGSANGPALYSEFNGPNGIGGTKDGNTIYVGEYSIGRIRIIQK